MIMSDTLYALCFFAIGFASGAIFLLLVLGCSIKAMSNEDLRNQR